MNYLKNKKSFLFYFILSITILFYLSYKAFFDQRIFKNYYYIYFIINIFLFSLSILFLNKKTKIYINIIFFIYFCILTELLLNVNLDSDTKARANKERTKSKYDTRNIIQFYNDTNINGDLTILTGGK